MACRGSAVRIRLAPLINKQAYNKIISQTINYLSSWSTGQHYSDHKIYNLSPGAIKRDKLNLVLTGLASAKYINSAALLFIFFSIK